MKYFSKFHQHQLNEASNSDNIAKANRNIKKAKDDTDNDNKFARHIANILSNLNKIEISDLSEEEQAQFQAVVKSLQEVVKGKEDIVFTDSKPKRKQRFDAIAASLNDSGEVDFGDLNFQSEDEAAEQEKEQEAEDKETTADTETPTEDTETTDTETPTEDTETTDTETPTEAPAEESGNELESSVKNNVPTFDKIAKMDKLPYLTQRLFGRFEPDEVKLVQALLKSKGLLEHNTIIEAVISPDDPSIDGKYGKGTTAAVRKYQEEKGLDADGKVGPATWKAMLGELGIDKDIEGINYEDYQKLEAPETTEEAPVEDTEAPKEEAPETPETTEEAPAKDTAAPKEEAPETTEEKPKIQAGAGAQGKELANQEEAALKAGNKPKQDKGERFKNINVRQLDRWMQGKTSFSLEKASADNKEYAENFYAKLLEYLKDRQARSQKDPSKLSTWTGMNQVRGTYNAIKKGSKISNADIEKLLKGNTIA